MAFLQPNDRADMKQKKTLFRVVKGGISEVKPDSRISDLALVQRISTGDQLAMKQVYDEHSGPLFHFVKNWLADPHEASDIVHETMLEIWRRADRFQGRSSLKSWIFSIARNKSIDKNRKSSRMTYTDVVPEVVDGDADPVQALELSQDAETLKKCVEKLSPTHRRMIHLAFYEDMTYKEISEIEDCPIGTVKTRILHAKKLLMRSLNSQNAS